MVLGECGRIENDHIELVADIVQILKGIDRLRRVAYLIAKIEAHILVCQLHGTLRAIDRNHLFGAACHCIDRKTARVAERIEHGATLGVVADELPVSALVDEEARLLTLFPIDFEAVTIFEHLLRCGCRRAIEIGIDCVQTSLERYGLRALVVDGLDTVAIDRTNGLADLLA